MKGGRILGLLKSPTEQRGAWERGKSKRGGELWAIRRHGLRNVRRKGGKEELFTKKGSGRTLQICPSKKREFRETLSDTHQTSR